MYDVARVCPRIVLASALWILTVGAAAHSSGPQRITLAQAQGRAAVTRGADLAQYAIDAAEYHRKAVQADYFPKVDSTFANLHFNKFLGQTFQLARRSAALPLLDDTLRADPNLYPSEEAQKRLHLPKALDQKSLRMWSKAWDRAKGLE